MEKDVQAFFFHHCFIIFIHTISFGSTSVLRYDITTHILYIISFGATSVLMYDITTHIAVHVPVKIFLFVHHHISVLSDFMFFLFPLT